jgi:hypothetical protein
VGPGKGKDFRMRKRAAWAASGALGVVVVAAILPAAAEQRSTARTGERIAITACPYAGSSGNCLMINGPDGMVYNISGAAPRPRLIGRMIWLRGTVVERASACGQGVGLERVRWTRVRQRCAT